MEIESKWLTAKIVETKGASEDTGGFEAILSTPDRDRDGEEIDVKSWGELPESIPVNIDHDMSVLGIVGTGTPRIEDGVVKLSVTFANTDQAQMVRGLVNDGHVKSTSVEFLRRTSTDSKGVKTTSREMIGAALTPYPANPNAVVLSSKAGARNSKRDAEMIQQIHDHALALGATPGKSVTVIADGDTETEPEPTRGTVSVTISGTQYLMGYTIYSDGSAYGGSLLPYPDETESADQESAAPAAVTESADEAKSLFELEAQAVLMTATPYIGVSNE